jgi:hypothetical protein
MLEAGGAAANTDLCSIKVWLLLTGIASLGLNRIKHVQELEIIAPLWLQSCRHTSFAPAPAYGASARRSE